MKLCDTTPALSTELREFWIYGRTCLLKGDISTDKTEKLNSTENGTDTTPAKLASHRKQ